MNSKEQNDIIKNRNMAMELLDNSNINFNISFENLFEFTESINIMMNEIGLVSFDMDDFQNVVKGSKCVDFFAVSGDNIVTLAEKLRYNMCDEICNVGNILFIITTNELPQSAEPFENAIDIISNGLDIKDFCFNIYERHQKEKYKTYLFYAIQYNQKRM